MNLKEIALEPVSQVRRRAAVCVPATTPLISVVDLMEEYKRGAVVIVDDDDRLLGIFSSRDLASRVDHSNHDWHKTPIADVMTKAPICVAESDSLTEALRLMEQGTFRHLPRIDAQGRPTAILSVRDILVYVSEQFPKEFVNLPPDPSHEATKPWGG